jgi:hypothetical protein
MGSFNETCALSNLNIPRGTRVRLLFLTQGPYVSSDEHETQRGICHNDLWFARTPPLKGEYSNYGQVELDESPLVKLVADVFSHDIVERPYGFNQYHAHPVLKNQDLEHYLTAARQGRLLVQDGYNKPRPVPEHYPTWQRIFAIFKEAALPLQHEDSEGYNAVPVMPGVVAIDYNSYGDLTEYFKKAKEVLSPHYDCRFVVKFNDRPEGCLLVTPKGAFENPALLVDAESINQILNTHPEIACHQCSRQLSVLAVMVREDVWQAFCDIIVSSYDGDITKEYYQENLLKTYHKLLKKQDSPLFEFSDFRDVLMNIPFQTMIGTHIKHAIKNKYEDTEDLLTVCAEIAQIETIMSFLHRPWYIPPLGGQDSQWKLHTELLGKFYDISKQELLKEEAENE